MGENKGKIKNKGLVILFFFCLFDLSFFVVSLLVFFPHSWEKLMLRGGKKRFFHMYEKKEGEEKFDIGVKI